MILWNYGRNRRSLHFSILEFQPHEISKITTQLCIAIGRGHISVPKDSRFSLLSTWMEAHFSWMTRSCRSVDKKLVEDGQFSPFHCLNKSILLTWFDRLYQQFHFMILQSAWTWIYYFKQSLWIRRLCNMKQWTSIEKDVWDHSIFRAGIDSLIQPD